MAIKRFEYSLRLQATAATSTPKQEADTIAKMLEKLGFEVSSGKDAGASTVKAVGKSGDIDPKSVLATFKKRGYVLKKEQSGGGLTPVNWSATHEEFKITAGIAYGSYKGELRFTVAFAKS